MVIVRAISVHAGEEPQEVVFGAEEEAIELMDKFLLQGEKIAILKSRDGENLVAIIAGFDEENGVFRIKDIPEDKKESVIRRLRELRD